MTEIFKERAETMSWEAYFAFCDEMMELYPDTEEREPIIIKIAKL